MPWLFLPGVTEFFAATSRPAKPRGEKELPTSTDEGKERLYILKFRLLDFHGRRN